MSAYVPSKVLFVGDSKVGKTCYVCTYLSGNFPSDPPQVREPPVISVLFNDKKIKLMPCDTTGSTDYEKLRSLSYMSTDIIVLCFSLVDPKSLENIETYWLSEIQRERPGKPFILVGLKKDLRDNFNDQLKTQGLEQISSQKGEEMKEKIGAKDYIECSAANNENVKKVVESVIYTLINTPADEQQNGASSSDYDSDS